MATLCSMAASAGVPPTVDCKSANAPPGQYQDLSFQRRDRRGCDLPAAGPLAVRFAALRVTTDKSAGQAIAAIVLVFVCA
jgi:hypothetical protein